MQSDVLSCEAKFRIYFDVTPVAPLTSDRLQEISTRLSLGEHPERVTDLLQEIGGPSAVVSPPVRRLFIQGQNRRHDMDLLSHIHDDSFSYVSDGDYQQIHIFDRGQSSSSTPDLSLFRSPPATRETGYHPDQAERVGSSVRLVTRHVTTNPQQELTTNNTFDWATGVPVRRVRQIESEVIQSVDYTGLTAFAGGITFPRCVLTANYAESLVVSVDLAILDEAQFNNALPESTFLVSKPKGWSVLDFRGQANGGEIPTALLPVEDVRKLIPAMVVNRFSDVSPAQREKAPLSFAMRILLILNGLALIILDGWMWRRASLKEPKH